MINIRLDDSNPPTNIPEISYTRNICRRCNCFRVSCQMGELIYIARFRLMATTTRAAFLTFSYHLSERVGIPSGARSFISTRSMPLRRYSYIVIGGAHNSCGWVGLFSRPKCRGRQCKSPVRLADNVCPSVIRSTSSRTPGTVVCGRQSTASVSARL